jgi:uncharacterized protein with beta-barrel porin domain
MGDGRARSRADQDFVLGELFVSKTFFKTKPSFAVGLSLALAATVTVSAANLVLSTPALADGGAGGTGFGGNAANGKGGTGFTGNAGGNGDNFIDSGGGGGGGGAGGGNGGNGGNGGVGGAVGAGGAGGTSISPNGQNGGNGSVNNGGGGGGGGFNGNGAGAASINNASPLSGGSGGTGGVPASTSNGGGGGGAGGYGAIVTGNGSSTNASTIDGGNGGNGGAGNHNVGGNGGDGGVGVQFTTSGATFNNTGSVTGGNGGLGGAGSNGGTSGVAGAGGAGISGSGMTVTNSGTITGGMNGDGVTRANAITFTGGTNILQLQAGSTITGNVIAFSAADTLALGGSTNASFDVSQIGASAQYQGFGIFEKTGSSTWTLTGTNTAALPWTVNAGTLNVNGAMTNSTVAVDNGGTLAGTGTVANVAVASGGTFAPGNGTPGSSMAIVGNLALQSGAIYMVQVNPATSSFANVTGTATLGGATVLAIYAAGSYISKQYTILNTTGGVSGTFGSLVNTNLPANFTSSLSYDATHAYLNLTLGFNGPNFGSGLNVNQQNVANALTNFFNTSGGIPMVFGTLTPAGLTQVSGEAATGSQQTTFDAMNMFIGTMLDPFNRGTTSAPGGGASGYAAEGDASAYASDGRQRGGAERDAYAMFSKAPLAQTYDPRWSVWAAGFGGSQTTDGNAALGSNNTTSSVFGTAVGADYRISPFTIAGFALAGGGTNFSVTGSGGGHSDLFQAGAFVRHTVGAAYLSAALAYGWQDITTNRTVTVAGTDQLQAKFSANAFSGRLEGGYRFVAPRIGGIGITPYAAAQFTTFDLPSYAEQAIVGSNAFALAFGAKDVTDTRSELGIRTDKSWAMTDGILTLRGRLAWAHDYDPDRSIASAFQTLPGANFVVNGAAQASDSALVTASIEKKWLTGWSAAATFEGEFSDVTRSYAGKGVVRYQW